MENNEVLYMIVPAYNEQDTIRQVAKEWHAVLQSCVERGGG